MLREAHQCACILLNRPLSVAFLCELNLQSHPALAEQVAPASWFPNRTCGFPSHPALRFIPYSVKWQKIFIRAGQAPVIRTSGYSYSVMLLKNQASIYIFSVGWHRLTKMSIVDNAVGWGKCLRSFSFLHASSKTAFRRNSGETNLILCTCLWICFRRFDTSAYSGSFPELKCLCC